MGKYEKLKEYSPEKFRSKTRVKLETFAAMVLILVAAKNSRYRGAGRRGNLA
jgi:hypothetical protein